MTNSALEVGDLFSVLGAHAKELQRLAGVDRASVNPVSGSTRRDIAAALRLGAVGGNLGTRFIASETAPLGDEWEQAIAGAKSEDAIKIDCPQ